jgi:hypothetical protein
MNPILQTDVSPPPTRRALRLAGIIGIAASILVGIADVVLLYNPEGGYDSSTFNYLAPIPPHRLWLGHFLGVLVIPFEMVGFWQVSRAIAIGARRAGLAFFFISAYSVILGTVFHAAIAPIGLLVQAINSEPQVPVAFTSLLNGISSSARVLTVLLNVGVVLSSLLFALAVGFRPTLYPRWFAFLNPFVIFLLVLALASILPLVGNVIYPAAFSVAIFIFFTLSTMLLWNSPEASRSGSLHQG